MKSLFLGTLFLCCLQALAQNNYWQQQANFTIQVTLHDKDHSLDGFEKITYYNNSPDTLHFLWFHIWPNAYKNDRTAFSEQQLQNGSTNFYFSSKEQRGYINRLDFKVDNVTARTEDHPSYTDIIKIVLPVPLPPKQHVVITTPFHVQLPKIFSRSGYENGLYQITQWYPKPAVYDAQGWHPIPYLDEGEFYSEFGEYDVSITVPKNFTVAATGHLQNEDELRLLKKGVQPIKELPKKVKQAVKSSYGKKAVKPTVAPVATTNPVEEKTLRYTQSNIHDFAFFADKNFKTEYDTCRLASGKVIDVFTFYHPAQEKLWKAALADAKDALRTRSQWIGDYPYDIITVVQGSNVMEGGMEYPTITVLSPLPDAALLDEVIAHEIGHNWFYGAVASNERTHPWMDEGINSFYDDRYHQFKLGRPQSSHDQQKVQIQSLEHLLFQSVAQQKKDQPIETPADSFTQINYELVAYRKTAAWLQLLQDSVGRTAFDQAMQTYYQTWKFKHPTPADFEATFTHVAGEKSASLFSYLPAKGDLPNPPQKNFMVVSPLHFQSIIKYIQQPSKNWLFLSPIIGYNKYDKLMIGMIATNYKLPQNKFQYLAMPLYATNSKQLNGIGRLSYTWIPDNRIQKTVLSASGLRFSSREALDSSGEERFENFYRIVPSITLYFHQPVQSSIETKLQWKTYFIGEKQFSKYVMKTTDSLFYVDSLGRTNRYLNELTFTKNNYRALYPYDYSLQLQQAKEFYRVNLTAHYFFNYATGGGLQLRFFAAKFGYLHANHSLFATRYLPKLLGVTGEEDYTYSNYFIGRTASFANAEDAMVKNRGLAAQQIMIRDGGFKMRLDQFDFLQGRSENWVTAINLATTLPKSLLPIPLPVLIFADIGSYAEAWDKTSTGTRLKYVAGLQLQLFSSLVNIYAPVLYSKEYRDNLKTFPDLNTFIKRLTFSIDIDRFNPQRIAHKPLPF